MPALPRAGPPASPAMQCSSCPLLPQSPRPHMAFSCEVTDLFPVQVCLPHAGEQLGNRNKTVN
jgi:hypothetical protein